MNEQYQRSIADAPAGTPADAEALIAALRLAGADKFDPVRLHYIEVLAKRAGAHQASVRRILDTKLAQAIAAFNERFALARRDAGEALARSIAQYPHAASELQRQFAAGDFKGLRRLIATMDARAQGASLGALVRQLGQHSPDNAELKTLREFRNTWSKLSVDKQVAKALGQAPKNAGPINSHMLVLRSLALMRDISPDYLNRFMSYADALLSLDQCEKEKPATPKKPAARAAKK